MERHVVLGHELRVLDVVGVVPPAAPVAARSGVGPLGGGADVADRGVEPHVPDLVLEARPADHRHAPVEVTGDAAILEPLGEPLAGDRQRERVPVIGVALDPRLHLPRQLRLQQEDVLGLAHLEVGAAGDGGARLEQVGGVEDAGAVLALVAAGAVVAAVRAGADDVAVGQEAVVGQREHLLGDALLEVPVLVELLGEVVRELVVRRRGRAPEVVPAQPEALADLLLHRVLLPAELRHRHITCCSISIL